MLNEILTKNKCIFCGYKHQSLRHLRKKHPTYFYLNVDIFLPEKELETTNVN